ncbi:MAG: bifunctional phosphopantothenoylcysteine decarboxylase/phosphopantothenate--cysteine ligase CoaBC [Bacteroidota bacterium]
MYVHPATQANVERLRRLGYLIMEPSHGALASGLVGQGRLPEPEEILAEVTRRLAPATDLAGVHVLVTAGPTREAVDPVRFLSNPSTGTMGFALAAAAAERGATVTLIAGPTTLATPPHPGITRHDVTTADEMQAAVQAHRAADLVLMAAAVADYAPTTTAAHKLKKGDGDLTISLRRTPDILATLGAHKRPGQCLVGFAMETENGLANAQAKLTRKNLDWIALNTLTEPGAGFGTTTNRVTLIRRDGHTEALPLASKAEVARALLARVSGK